MTKRIALRCLKAQKNKLQSVNNPLDFELWKTQTLNYIESAFKKGEESTEYKLIKHNSGEFPPIEESEHDRKLNILRLRVTKFLDNYIETLKSIGVPKKGNFLTRLSEGWLIAILTFVLPGLLVVGSLWGKYLSDTQNIELKIENNELKKTRSGVSPVPQNTDNITGKETDTTNKTQ